MRFEEERSRPCHDLLARIRVEPVHTVIDLGCGPGNSTAALAGRWPNAKITGIDSSREMLLKARETGSHEWLNCDIESWIDAGTDAFEVVFSNAALHWVADHKTVYPRLLSRVAPGGALAVQVPANLGEIAQITMSELASSHRWRDRFPAEGVHQWFVHDAGFYYDVLSKQTQAIDLWETTYLHVLPNVAAIGEWYRSTGLRPFLKALSTEPERNEFVNDYVSALAPHYPLRADGSILFPFRRLFLVATR